MYVTHEIRIIGEMKKIQTLGKFQILVTRKHSSCFWRIDVYLFYFFVCTIT